MEFLLKITAHGKINLTLDVLGKRDDGYHEVEMIMQSVSLSDRITMEKTDNGITLDCAVEGVARPQDNLIYKAASLFFKTYKPQGGVKISLKKNIPVAAGLAGGSSDAAAVLRGMNKLFKLNLSDNALCGMGAKLGSDIPFCIKGGTMLARGRGEIISPAPAMPSCALVIVKPNLSISTAWVYNNYKNESVKNHPDSSLMLQQLKNKNLSGVCAALENVLESVTISTYPQLAAYKEELCRCGAEAALMSGSGPCIFAVYPDTQRACEAADKMRHAHADLAVYEAVPVDKC